MRVFLEKKKMAQIYHELHIITLETAFVVRTFFFVIFGLTIVISSLFDLKVALISVLILISIYALRFLILRVFIGKDILPQLFIAPRGLITVLLFYAIPKEAEVATFESGILLFVIIGTSLIMTWAMIKNKHKMRTILDDIDEELIERNEAEDALNEHTEQSEALEASEPETLEKPQEDSGIQMDDMDIDKELPKE